MVVIEWFSLGVVYRLGSAWWRANGNGRASNSLGERWGGEMKGIFKPIFFLLLALLACCAAPPDTSRLSKPDGELALKHNTVLLNNEIASYTFPHPVVSIAWSPDGRRLAVSYDEDKQVALIDRATVRTMWTIAKLASHFSSVCCRLLFSPDGAHLYTASAVTRGSVKRDVSVSILDTRDGSITGAFAYHEPPGGASMALDMALSHDGKTLYAIPGMTNEVIAFDTRTGAVTNKFVAQEGVPETGRGFTRGRLVLDEDRGRLWFAHQGTLVGWSLDGKSVVQVQAFQLGVTAMALNKKTGDIVAGGTSEVEQSRFPRGRRVKDTELRTYSDPAPELVRGFDGATTSLKRKYIGPSGGVEGLAVSKDGSLIVAAKSRLVTGEHARLLVWDTETGQLLAEHDCGYADLGDVLFSPDGQLLAYVEGKRVKVLKISR